MLTRRLIVCLDVKGGRVVKGVQFEGLRDVGDPVQLAQRYEAEGAVVGHNGGRPVSDGWQSTPSLDPLSHMLYGPYDANVPVGPRKVAFRVKTDNNTLGAQTVATVDVWNSSQGVSLATLNLTSQQFTSANQYQDFSLGFNQTAPGQTLEYRVYFTQTATVTVDAVTVN